jgi:hypothetical protein
MLAVDNTALHAKFLAAGNSDIASKAAHADFATTLAASRRNARALAQRIKVTRPPWARPCSSPASKTPRT